MALDGASKSSSLLTSVTDQNDSNQVYCNGFAQSVSKQRLGEHVPTCNDGRCVSINECHNSLLGNSQRANELAG
jgi:hypothetical protein